MGGSVVGTATHLGDKPSVNDLIGSIKIMLDAYSEGKIDRLYVVHNEFVNSMTQTPVVTQLLPASGVGTTTKTCRLTGTTFTSPMPANFSMTC